MRVVKKHAIKRNQIAKLKSRKSCMVLGQQVQHIGQSSISSRSSTSLLPFIIYEDPEPAKESVHESKLERFDSESNKENIPPKNL